MENDAITTDVSTEEQVRPMSEREKIFAQAQATRKAELEEEGVEFEKAEDEVDQLPPEEKAEPEKIEVKIDGETNHVTPDEINEALGAEGEVTQQRIAEYQKHKSADKRLEEAAQRTKKLEEQERAQQERARQLAEKEAQIATIQATPAGEKPAEISQEMVQKLTDAFITEDHEESTKILNEIFTAAKGPASTEERHSYTEDDIRRAARNELAAIEYEKSLSTGRATLKKEFNHLISDPIFQAGIDKKAEEIFYADKSKPPGDILIEAAKAVEEKYRLSVSDKKPKTDAQLKEEKKRAASVHATPKTASAKAGGKPTALVNTSVVQQMIEARNRKLAGMPPA